MKKHLLNDLNNHYNAAKRLDIKLIGTNYDVFAVDVYYHKACYNRFTYEYQKKTTARSFSKTAILHYVLHQTELKVIKKNETFLVNKLMKDIQEISEGHDLEESPAKMRHSNRLKENLLDHFGEKIQFTKIGNKNVLHTNDVSALTYTERNQTKRA